MLRAGIAGSGSGNLHRCEGANAPARQAVHGAKSLAVLFVADLVHPVDNLAVLRFRDGNVRHRRCAVQRLPCVRAILNSGR